VYDGVNAELVLIGSLRNQLVVELENFSFNVPRWAFQHSNPNEPLVFEATTADGSPLPDWLKFDEKKLAFFGTPPEGATDLTITITASDSYGNEVSANFTVTVERPVKEVQVQPIKIANTGFTRQIQLASQAPLEEESEAIVESAYMFPDFSIILDFDED
jgi:hypothetical protein